MEPSDDPRKRKREEEEGRPEQEDLVFKASEDEPKKSKTGPLSWMVPKPAQPSADGVEISLYANFFTVEWRPEAIYVFHMHIEPAAGVGVHVKRTLLFAHKEALGRYEFWGELLFAKKDLGGNTFKAQINGTEYTLTLSERIPAGRLNFIDSDRMVMFSRLLKTVFARLRYVRIRDSVYDVSAPIRYQDMEAFPGYSTNVNLFQGGLMLNIDTSFKWVQTRTVLDMLSDAGSDKARQAAVVANQIVLTRYSDRRGDRRFYRVSCLDFDKTPASTFPRRRKKEHKYAEAEEEMISFRDYFKEAHNLDIQNMRQPLLKVIEKRRRPTDGVQVEETIYLVPEFCVLAGMTESFRTNGQLRRGAMEATGMAASKKMESVMSLIGKLQPGRIVEDRKTREKIEPGRLLAEWGLYINERPMSLKGRQITTRPLVIGSEKQYRISTDTAEWRDLFGAPPTKRNAPPREPGTGLFKPVDITNWALFHLRNHADSVHSMLQAYDTVLPELKLNLGPPVKIVVNNENHYADEMRRVWEDSKKSGRPIALFVVILPSSNATVYGKIKAVMATTPVLTQCVQVRTIKATSGLESKCKGILQQMVCKLGGSPWTIDMGPFRERPSMIVGIDVSHSKTAIRGSVLAMTATIDPTFTRYFSDVIVQGQGQEMGSGIAACFDKALLAFRDHNRGLLPQRIIVYRDDPGGKGALEALKETEIDMMRRKLQERRIRASLTFIVVRKRGIVRLFSSNMGNPPPGTLVDTGVVSKDYNDFYLIAHTSRRGAVKPTQYQIVYRERLPDAHHDNALNTPDIQKLSYMLCHLYFNFMGTIAEPAPLRYADRLANMVRQTLGGSIPRSELSNALYYL